MRVGEGRHKESKRVDALGTNSAFKNQKGEGNVKNSGSKTVGKRTKGMRGIRGGIEKKNKIGETFHRGSEDR